MRLLFIRHGDPDYVHDSLTEEGFREAKALGAFYKNQQIDHCYCSPLGRAKDTMQGYLDAVKGKEPPHEVLEWLHEFRILVPHGPNRVAWDFLPEYLEQFGDQVYDKDSWYKPGTPWGDTPGMKEYVEETLKKFDGLLAEYGYVREGRHYVCKESSDVTIAFFCHFGIIGFLLSHLMNCSPVSIWQNTCITPSGVCEVFTEERRKGQVLFRASSIGDTSHLAAAGLKPEFAARFSETYDDPRRHD